MRFNIAVLPGDGVGPEVMAEALRVLGRIGGVEEVEGQKQDTD